MTAARVKAAQATKPPKGVRLLRGTVATVSPLTVLLAGGTAVGGIVVPGATYSVGDAVGVLWQEPGVGPVYPLSPAPSDAAGIFGYSGTCSDWDSGRWKTSITRAGKVGTLALAFKVGGGGFPTTGGTIGTLPAGFQPFTNLGLVASVYSPGWNGQTAHLQLNSATDGGGVSMNWSSDAVAAGALITAAASFRLP